MHDGAGVIIATGDVVTHRHERARTSPHAVKRDSRARDRGPRLAAIGAANDSAVARGDHVVAARGHDREGLRRAG